MAVFHPLKHTPARRERGIAERKGRRQTEETVGGVLLLKHTPACLIPISRSLTAPFADTERSENRLRLFTAAPFFFCFPWCSCAHISLYHTRAERMRLKQRAGETARILPRLHGHQKGDLLFHFVAVSIRIAGRKETTWTAGAEHRHQSLLIKATSQEYFTKTARALCLSTAPPCLFR